MSIKDERNLKLNRSELSLLLFSIGSIDEDDLKKSVETYKELIDTQKSLNLKSLALKHLFEIL